MSAAAGAHAALARRAMWGPILGVLLSAAVLTGVGWATSNSMGLGLPIWAVAAAALVLFSALEVGVHRQRVLRMARLAPLFAGLVDALGEAGEPAVSWSRGLPRLRGLRSGRRFAVHLESAGARLRVGLTVGAHAGVVAWIASRQPEDFPARPARALQKQGFEVVRDDDLLVLAFDRAVAGPALEPHGDALRALLFADAPCAATLDIGFESTRWDTTLTQRITPTRLLELVDTIGALLEALGPEPAEAEAPAADR